METRRVGRGVLAALFLLFVLGGAGLGLWNQQQVSACHERYDDDPTVAVTCEDPFTDVVTALSALGIAVGGLGFVSLRSRRTAE